MFSSLFDWVIAMLTILILIYGLKNVVELVFEGTVEMLLRLNCFMYSL